MTGSLVVFPTIVNKSPVSSMNGDYDGDVYLICAQKDLVNQVKAHKDMMKNKSDSKVFCRSRINDTDERPLVVLPKAPSMNRRINFNIGNNKTNSNDQTSDEDIIKENTDCNTVSKNINFKFKTISSPVSSSKSPSKSPSKLSSKSSSKSLTNDHKDTSSQICDFSSSNETVSKEMFKRDPNNLHPIMFNYYLFLEFLYYFKNKVRIGKLSNDWFSVACRLGANNKLALLQADYFSECMNDRKNKHITENGGIDVNKLISNIEDNSVIYRLARAFQFEFLKQDITLQWSPIVITLDEDLKHERAVKLLPEALTFYRQFCSEFSKIAKQDLGDPQDVKRAMMFSVSSSSLQDQFQCIFDELCDQLYDLDCNNNIATSRNDIRKGLASALYEVSYSEAVNIYKTNNNSNSNAIFNSVMRVLRCPWILVVDILNNMKIENKTIDSTSSLLQLGIENISLNDK